MNIKKLETIFYATPKMNHIRHIHFIGIGGSGMCGLAEVLSNEGYDVSGSDLVTNECTTNLASLGIKIYSTHHPDNIDNANVIVTSSAISNNNSEIIAAKKAKIPIIKRAEMLSELMRYRQGIAIAGTHGKTTTTSMVTSIYIKGGLDPTIVNGGLIKSIGKNGYLGRGRYIIVEADESDASFLYLKPIISIITNIEADHMENYRGNLQNLKKVFISFINNLPFYGKAIICIDDNIICNLIPYIKRKITTYGFRSDADLTIKNYKQCNSKGYFTLLRKGHKPLNVILNAIGKHNALNATAAIAAATEVQIKDKDILQALENFQGTSRRFDFLGEFSTHLSNGILGRAMLFDDYGHHPTEIDAIIKSIRCNWIEKKLIMIFQPHRYTRTRDLFDEFVNVLSKVDVLIILNVYSAGELPIDGADSHSLCNQIRYQKKINPILAINYSMLENILYQVFSGNDLIITQGAGDIDKIARKLAANKLQISFK